MQPHSNKNKSNNFGAKWNSVVKFQILFNFPVYLISYYYSYCNCEIVRTHKITHFSDLHVVYYYILLLYHSKQKNAHRLDMGTGTKYHRTTKRNQGKTNCSIHVVLIKY